MYLRYFLMKIYIVNEATSVALELGDISSITNDSEFDTYTSKELLGKLFNKSTEITALIEKALIDFGVTDHDMIFGPKDYIIKSPSSDFFFYCEDTIQDDFTIIPLQK